MNIILNSSIKKEGLNLKEKIKGNNYVYWGLTLFAVIAASILLFFVLLKADVLFACLIKLIYILSPILIGLLFAYLLNPLVKKVDKYITKNFLKLLSKKVFKGKKFSEKTSRILSIFFTYLFTLATIILVISFVIPSLLDSINMMLTNVPGYINNIYDTLKNALNDNPELMKMVDKWNSNITDAIAGIMLPSMDMIFTNLTSGISSLVKWTINIIIGIIVSVYLIYDKDSFIKGSKKLLVAILPQKAYDTVMTTCEYTNKIFGGFMIAKIIDSLIIGVLTFIIISIFKIPYALIISVIVGVTNIIPYFGPFIGAIPCAALLLLIDPTKSLTFTVLILIIQQFDGNILGPKLIGNKTGIKSFWVLFSILLFGGLFGFVGMIFGVPVFAVIYSLVNTLIEKKLNKKNKIKEI